ncbi:hypothetical protein [Aureimonas sp. AU20]|uniref:hypothetical protein n=1 Tax=Aureimonas sp. AU20 TaxID=1349819 RepID=UPI0007217C39|nr:hypothetical protein [Aureimonas sp. AU20]ALN74146.1 hypothetical protein M673_15570 [Aureimonas sp. AU20]
MKTVLGVALCALILGSGALRAEESGHDATAASSGHEVAAEPAAATPGAEGEEAGAAWAKTRTPMPFDVMRSVQFLQDQVARGNDRAIRVQALILRRFGRTFLEADPAVWQDPRNFRAAVLFALSGGTPEVLQRLMREKLLDEAQTPLLEGTLAYVSNDLEKARKRLSGVELEGMEPVLAAQLSLVLGQINQVDHPEVAIPHLDRARLLAPGTLIEEASLRLGATLVDDSGDHGRADQLARRYFDRFSNSAYAGNFEARFTAMVTSRAAEKADETLADMSDIIASLPDPRRQTLYLAASRRSLVEGNLHFAQAAADAALAIPGLGDADRDRAELYETASALGSLKTADARRTLDAIDRTRLHPEDVKLLDAAYSVLDSIDATLAEMPAGAESAAPAEAVPAVLARAEAALAQSSQVLKP